MSESSPDLAERFIFITGDTASAPARDFLESTGNPVLNKPLGIDAVRELLKPLVDNQRSS